MCKKHTVQQLKCLNSNEFSRNMQGSHYWHLVAKHLLTLQYKNKIYFHFENYSSYIFYKLVSASSGLKLHFPSNVFELN